MNIVFVTNTLNQVGGIERVIERLSNYFIEVLNYNIHIISVYSPHNDNFFKLNKNISVTNLGIKYSENNSLKSRFLKCKEINNRIKEVLNDKKFDVIMTFHSTISSAILFNKKNFKEKIVVTEHNSYKYYSKLRHIINIINYRKADKLVVLTQSDKKFYSKFIKNVEQIPNSIPFSNDIFPNYNNKRIISVGRIEEVKGFDYLIDAFYLIYKKYSEWTLHIVGDGTQKQILEDEIKKYNLEEQIIIEPFTKEIKNKYLGSSIYALSSRFEGFSLVILEAMECGLPIVSFDIDAAMEILKDGEDSLIAEKFNIKEFAEKLSVLMDDEEKRETYGKMGKKNVQRYNINQIGTKWNKLFESIVK